MSTDMFSLSAMSQLDLLHQPIGIIGAGVAGLINAQVLLKDGFTDVTLISRDKSVGGTWARERVYPGLHINNVHGEYRFSGLPMPAPENSTRTGGRLSGLDMCNYMERFSERFLVARAKFLLRTEVSDVVRDAEGTWRVSIREPHAKEARILTFSRIILASGGCSNPNIPPSLSQEAADKVGYHGLIVHSSHFASQLDSILAATRPTSPGKEARNSIVVVGGGKSAQDACTKLSKEGRKVKIVYDDTDAFIASPVPIPAFLRKSRYFSIMVPHINLRTRLERFLHTTTIGSAIARGFWSLLQTLSYAAYNIPKGSPLRSNHSMFWSIRVNDIGAVQPDSFHSLVNAGMIDVIAPARVVGYTDDGTSVLLSNGLELPAKVVILATGYRSSWAPIFTPEMAEELGINRHEPQAKSNAHWNYKSLYGAPPLDLESQKWVTSIYRGLVPAKNIQKRDFAIAGGLFSSNVGYSSEVAAHWIASYFRSDRMRLPSTTQEAVAHAEQRSAWMKARFPESMSWVNESYSTSLDFFTWPQAADELLEDMYLPSMRSGGNWLNWMFKTIDLKEIENLTEERGANQKLS